ncbi:MAG TPA: hypothetical protein VN757_11360 [Steroidobacteraceae bacterium]|nr:hypothetical protein [Steroidobacteraceae bacterium]
MSAPSRLVTAAAWACLLLLPAVHCAAGAEDLTAARATMRRDAHQFADSVRRESKHFGNEVAHGARELKRDLKHWWNRMRVGTDHAGAALRDRLHSA